MHYPEVLEIIMDSNLLTSIKVLSIFTVNYTDRVKILEAYYIKIKGVGVEN